MKTIRGIYRKKETKQPNIVEDIVNATQIVEELRVVKKVVIEALDAKIEEAEYVIAEAKTGTRDTLKRFEDTIASLIRDIRALPYVKGDKGDRGADGTTPIKGVHYFTADDIAQTAETVIGMIRLPEDGKDAIVDTKKLTDAVVQMIIRKKLLNTEHISGLRGEIDSYRHQMAMKQAGQHGGGDTVVAGANITITNNTNGTKTIAAAAAAIPNIATEQVTAVQAGDHVTIALSQLAHTYSGILGVYRNGQNLTPNGSASFPGSSWSQSGGTIIVYNADAGDIFLIQYVYA